jgi:hypothetical protein
MGDEAAANVFEVLRVDAEMRSEVEQVLARGDGGGVEGFGLDDGGDAHDGGPTPRRDGRRGLAQGRRAAYVRAGRWCSVSVALVAEWSSRRIETAASATSRDAQG